MTPQRVRVKQRDETGGDDGGAPLLRWRRWRRDPIRFIEETLVDPESGQPFHLLDAERAFLQHAFQTDASGRLLYPEQIYSCPKKSGKTTLGALITIVVVLLFGGSYPEATLLANDLEQSRGRVFEMVKRIIESSPHLNPPLPAPPLAKITNDRITFPTLNATITPIASDAGSAAGGAQSISVFDELWAYVSERSRRLWDEMVPVPTKQISLRLTVTYAGFEGESTLLQELYKRGLQQPLVGPDLHAGDGILMFWSHTPVAPWQTEAWLAEMRRSLRPNAFLRMIENKFVTTESTFVDLDWWDDCVVPTATPLVADKSLSIWVGIDASVKHDSTAIVAVTWDQRAQTTRLVFHRIYQPTSANPIDFERTVEATVTDLNRRFHVRKVLFDPYQMHASAQRLAKAGIPMEEFPQSVPNLTEASQHLFELIKGRNLVVYPDADIRLAVSRCVALETARGWRISKDTQSHRIDVAIALAMAALAAVKSQGESDYDLSGKWIDGVGLVNKTSKASPTDTPSVTDRQPTPHVGPVVIH